MSQMVLNAPESEVLVEAERHEHAPDTAVAYLSHSPATLLKPREGRADGALQTVVQVLGSRKLVVVVQSRNLPAHCLTHLAAFFHWAKSANVLVSVVLKRIEPPYVRTRLILLAEGAVADDIDGAVLRLYVEAEKAAKQQKAA